MPRYTQNDVLDALGLCLGCGERKRADGSVFCAPCDAEDERVRAAIRASRGPGPHPTIATILDDWRKAVSP